jgi:hypothetical protein
VLREAGFVHELPGYGLKRNVEARDKFPSRTLVRLRATLRCDWNELFAGCGKV